MYRSSVNPPHLLPMAQAFPLKFTSACRVHSLGLLLYVGRGPLKTVVQLELSSVSITGAIENQPNKTVNQNCAHIVEKGVEIHRVHLCLQQVGQALVLTILPCQLSLVLMKTPTEMCFSMSWFNDKCEFYTDF